MNERHKKLFLWVLTVILFMSFLFAGSVFYYFNLRPLTFSEKAPVITLPRATTASQLVQKLQQQNIIKYQKPYLYYLRFTGLAAKLKAGVYEIKPDNTPAVLFDRIAKGDVLTRKFTIIAGTTQQKISQDLSQAAYLNYHVDDWQQVQGRYPSSEGLLLADTYVYYGGSDSKNLLLHAHRNLMTLLNKTWQARDPDLPYKTSYELLIAASIIEKETALPSERSLISGVIINRLYKNMPLQMDPTVIYALGNAYTGKLSHQNLQVNSPFNSYKNRGLPPTPIAMVGEPALYAAAHPQRSNFLYYVAKGDGSHQFSETYQQQRQAIELYQRK